MIYGIKEAKEYGADLVIEIAPDLHALCYLNPALVVPCTMAERMALAALLGVADDEVPSTDQRIMLNSADALNSAAWKMEYIYHATENGAATAYHRGDEGYVNRVFDLSGWLLALAENDYDETAANFDPTYPFSDISDIKFRR